MSARTGSASAVSNVCVLFTISIRRARSKLSAVFAVNGARRCIASMLRISGGVADLAQIARLVMPVWPDGDHIPAVRSATSR